MLLHWTKSASAESVEEECTHGKGLYGKMIQVLTLMLQTLASSTLPGSAISLACCIQGKSECLWCEPPPPSCAA